MKRIFNALSLAVLLFFVAACDPPRVTVTPTDSPDTTEEKTLPSQTPSGYNHDRWVTLPRDHVRHFQAFTVSFDGRDDDDNDGSPDLRGQPEWVAYQINQLTGPLNKSPKRPPWFTDQKLHSQGIAPDDHTYHRSGYNRGHMCMKSIGFRLGKQADHETHTFLNACPQEQSFNGGVWRNMENNTMKWADIYGSVWVVCGPVFTSKNPKLIGDPGEMKIPVPDAFYKIVIRGDGESVDVLPFLYPHQKVEKIGGHYRQEDYLTSVDAVEEKTGLNFLSILDDAEEDAIEAQTPKALWK